MSTASAAGSSTSTAGPIPPTSLQRRSRRRPPDRHHGGRAARARSARRPPSRCRSLARADNDWLPSITTSGAGDAVASRSGGGARRRSGHRPRPVRGRARRRGPCRDRLALPVDHRRARARCLRRHQPSDRLRGALRVGGRGHRGRTVRSGASRLPRLRRHPGRLPDTAVRDRSVARPCRRRRGTPAVPPGRPWTRPRRLPTGSPRSGIPPRSALGALVRRGRRPAVQRPAPPLQEPGRARSVHARESRYVQPCPSTPVRVLCPPACR